MFAWTTTTLHVWDVAASKEARKVSFSEPTSSGALTTDGKLFARSLGHAVVLWDTTSGKPLVTSEGHSGAVSSVVFSEDGKSLLSTGDGSVRYWELSSGKQRSVFAVGDNYRTGLFRSASFLDIPWPTLTSLLSPDGHTIVTVAKEESKIELWNLTTRKAVWQGEQVFALVPPFAFSRDGKTVAWTTLGSNASRKSETVLVLRDCAGGKERGRLTFEADFVSALALSWDGKQAAAGLLRGKGESKVRVWDVDSGRERNDKIESDPGRNNDLPHCLAFSPDGRLLAIGSGAMTANAGPGLVHVLDAATGKLRHRWKGHPSMVTALAFTADGRTLASGDATGDVRLWEVATGKEQFHRQAGSGVSSLGFSPDGKRLATGLWNTTVLIWELTP